MLMVTMGIAHIPLLAVGGITGTVLLGLATGSVLLYRAIKKKVEESSLISEDISDFITSLHGLTNREVEAIKTAAHIARIQPVHQLLVSQRLFDRVKRQAAVRGQVEPEVLTQAAEKLFNQTKSGPQGKNLDPRDHSSSQSLSSFEAA